jgi:hypothetical protein
MKPICVKCKKFYRPKENGYCFTEGMPTSSGEWKPYKAWMGDLWECPECGHQLIAGVGFEPISEHYRPDFEAARKHFRADQLRIDDCWSRGFHERRTSN